MAKVELESYKGREQAYIKHCLLDEYLSSWCYKIGSKWDFGKSIDVRLAGSTKRRKPSATEDDRIFVIDREKLKCHK